VGSAPGADISARSVIRRTISRNRLNVTVGTTLLCLHQLAETAVPIAIGVIVDRGVRPGEMTGIVIGVAALALIFAALTTCYQLGARRINVAMHTEAHRLRMEVAEKALSPHGIRTDLARGELLTVSSTDAERAAWFIDLVPKIAAASTAILATSIALVVIDVSLGLAVIVGVPLFVGLLTLVTPLITARAVRQQTRIAQSTALAGDLISGIRSIKGIGAEAAAAQRYRVSSRSALEATMSTIASTATQRGVTAAISALIATAIAIAAGWYALAGRLTIGELVAVVGLAQFLIEPLTSLSARPAFIAKARGSAERVATVLSAPPLLGSEPSADTTTTTDGASIRLVDVHHRTLAGLDLEAGADTITAVFPYEAADGESLAEVLSTQLDPQAYRGLVEVGGVDATRVPVGDLRRTVVAEPHAAALFTGSVGANVTAGADDVDAARVSEALRASAVEEMLAHLPDGTDHQLTDRGRNLSGGQRQRVALARALYADAPVLVLHEPTTAVDSVTEQQMAEGICRLRARPGATTVLITTSPALLEIADRVTVVRSGRAVTDGHHQDLLATDHDYAAAVLR